MVESGGPATQAGVYYQNTIAALYLGRLLDLRRRRADDRVVHVRVEAPADVDDIVVRTGAAAHRFIQAKLSLAEGTDAWRGVWRSFARQLARKETTVEDEVVLVVGEPSDLARVLRALCERAISAVDEAEYRHRLGAEQTRTFDAIRHALRDECAAPLDVIRLLARTRVEVWPDDAIERDLAPRWMPEVEVAPERLLPILRDLAGGDARIRGAFDAASLRARLRTEHGIEILPPEPWGTAKYRDIVLARALIEVPGTDVVRPISDDFVWPVATRYDLTRRPDFDDEHPLYRFGLRADDIDLRRFPANGLDRVVVVAGPGLGKSVLTLALARRAVQQGLLPVIIRIPELSERDVGIREYLDRVNDELELAIDWSTAADAGLLVLLLDGLDEVSSDRRAVVLERIKTFEKRHDRTPWLLTVRDAAALSAPLGAQLLELEPLDDGEISEMVAFYRPGDEAFATAMGHALDARPALRRLARIPLFLALLVATSREPAVPPAERAALLEAYLDLLLRPEQFKRQEADSVDAAMLRRIAEAVAFEALERGEIGIGVRELQSAIQARIAVGTAVQPVIERLVKCGIVRQRLARYEFPFPIVQEYLAACHILAARSPEIETRLSLVAKRPWAQTLQFVLEQHPDPSALVGALLDRDDDAFSSNLRLVARCVANGMRLPVHLTLRIGRGLAQAWGSVSWRLRRQIGRLVCDAFSTPLLPEIRARILERWTLNDGAGAIVTRLADPELTRELLRRLLDDDVEHLFNLGELQPAVDALGDVALAMYAESARSSEDVERHASMAALIGHLDPTRISAALRDSIALDEEMPLVVRLAAFGLGPTPLDERALPLVERAIHEGDARKLWLLDDAIRRTRDPAALVHAMLMRPSLDELRRLEILDFAPRLLPEHARATLLATWARDSFVPEEVHVRLLVFAARFGNRAAMEELVERIPELRAGLVAAAISVMGHHPSRELVARAVAAIRARQWSPSERSTIARYVPTGMTFAFEMDAFLSGTLAPIPPHPGLDLFAALLEEWADARELAAIAAIQLDHDLVDLGSRIALERLLSRIATVATDSAIEVGTHEASSAIGGAIRAVHDRQVLLPLRTLEVVLDRCDGNGALAAIAMIGAHGTTEALTLLLDAYARERRPWLPGMLLDAIEPLALRLGLRVHEVDGRLEASAT